MAARKPLVQVLGALGELASGDTIAKADVGLGNVDNTSDANKPVSSATSTALGLKQDILVSGTTIKTINSNSILGSGDLLLVGGLVATPIKTTAYTGVVNDLVRVNSTAGAFTVTMPATPVDGDKFGLFDIANQCGTNAVLLAAAGGLTVEGDVTGLSVNVNGAYVYLIYNSATTNWKIAETPNASTGVHAETVGFTVTAGGTPKTLTVLETMTLNGVSGSTLNISTGGTLGTSAFTATATPTTLGLVIGTNVQAYNANLTAINQALTTTSSPSFTAVTANVTGNVSGSAGSVAVGGITGLGTGVATALAVNTGSAGSVVVNGGALGTPSSGSAANLTSFPTLNQSTTGTAAGLSGTPNISVGTVTASGATTIGARLQVTAAGSPPASGSGLEILGGANPLIFSYNRTGSAYLPLDFTASAFGWSIGATGTMSLTSTGLNSTNIGATTPGTGAFTTLSASVNVNTDGVFVSSRTTGPGLDITSLSDNNAIVLNGNTVYGYISQVGGLDKWSLSYGATKTTRGTSALEWSTAGVAVTGALSATGLITGRSTNGQVFTATNAVDSTLSVDIVAGDASIYQLGSSGTLGFGIGSTRRLQLSSAGATVTGVLSATSVSAVTNAATNAITARYNASNEQSGMFTNSGGQTYFGENVNYSSGDKYSLTGLPAARWGNPLANTNSAWYLDVAASGTAGNAISWVNAIQVLKTGEVGFGGTPVAGVALTVQGLLNTTGDITSSTSINAQLNGSDTVAAGAYYALRNTANNRAWIQQLSASNNVDWWHYNGSAWTKYMTLASTGLAVTGALSATGAATALQILGRQTASANPNATTNDSAYANFRRTGGYAVVAIGGYDGTPDYAGWIQCTNESTVQTLRLNPAGGTVSVGALLDLSAATSGQIKFPATQNASSDANTLDDYDEYTAASAACTGAITTAAVWKLTKVGNKVTLTLPAVTGTVPGGGLTSFTFGTAVPAKYRPVVEVQTVVVTWDNGARYTTSQGRVTVEPSAGLIQCYLGLTNPAFTNGAVGGLPYAVGISWTI